MVVAKCPACGWMFDPQAVTLHGHESFKVPVHQRDHVGGMQVCPGSGKVAVDGTSAEDAKRIAVAGAAATALRNVLPEVPWQDVAGLLAYGIVSAFAHTLQRKPTAAEVADMILNTSAHDTEGLPAVADGLLSELLKHPGTVRMRLDEMRMK